jgi:hypothetical protein
MAVGIDAVIGPGMAEFVPGVESAKSFSLEVEPAEVLATKRQATTIGDSVPLRKGGVNGRRFGWIGWLSGYDIGTLAKAISNAQVCLPEGSS